MRVVAFGWRVTADERCVGAQRPKPCKPVQALARVACAVPPALLARGGNGHATRAPPVQRVYMGGCVTGKDIAPVAEQTLQHTSSSATNSARIIILAVLALLVSYNTIRRTRH